MQIYTTLMKKPQPKRIMNFSLMLTERWFVLVSVQRLLSSFVQHVWTVIPWSGFRYLKTKNTTANASDMTPYPTTNQSCVLSDLINSLIFFTFLSIKIKNYKWTAYIRKGFSWEIGRPPATGSFYLLLVSRTF